MRVTAMRTMAAMWAAGLIGAAPLSAHMPYVLPSLFDAGTRASVTIEASFTEDAFRPEIAMQNAPFEITGPDGKTVPLGAPVLTHDLTLLDVPLPTDGLYRISSGQRVGRMGKMIREGESWKVVGEGAVPPAGATVVDVRSTTLADVYVLRGKPGATGALKPRGTALEIHPLGDPSSYAPGKPARFEILYDGKPLAGEQVSLFREAGFYDGNKQVAIATPDAAGQFAVTAPDPGRYLMLVRHRVGPSASGGPATSYTVTLTFEAM
jgi:uncharacterized GH25 family protein